MEFAKGGTAYIAEKIEEAVKNESRTATVSGNAAAEALTAAVTDAGYEVVSVK